MNAPPTGGAQFHIPLLGQRPTQQQMNSQLQAAINTIALQIYTQLVSQHGAIHGNPRSETADTFRAFKEYAQSAARCYFEQIEKGTE